MMTIEEKREAADAAWDLQLAANRRFDLETYHVREAQRNLSYCDQDKTQEYDRLQRILDLEKAARESVVVAAWHEYAMIAEDRM